MFELRRLIQVEKKMQQLNQGLILQKVMTLQWIALKFLDLELREMVQLTMRMQKSNQGLIQ